MPEADRRGVFISWSKPIAAEIAKQIKPFLEDVLGTATVFMSQAMEGGTRWSMEIPQRLESCNAGLVLVTKENSHEPWLQFEAGALSKHVDESRVVPLLCNATIGDIQGTPLSLFQAKTLDHDDFLSVCLLFGAAFGIAEETVRRRFERGWPDLDAAVGAAKGATSPPRQLTLQDLMAVLERVAGQITSLETALKPSPPSRGALSAYLGTPAGMFGGDARSTTLADLVSAGAFNTVPEGKGLGSMILELERARLRETQGPKTDALTSEKAKPARKVGRGMPKDENDANP